MTPESLLGEDRRELVSYAYSYPHKSSYRPLDPPVSLTNAWRSNDIDRLALYAHIPFCEMRCGFCNLFTQSQPDGDIVESYLTALRQQMRVVRDQLPDARFQQFAVGGGTPTFLSHNQLKTLLEDVETNFAFSIAKIPTSAETSPATATAERLQVLADFGVERISIGVQSFIDDESRQIGRPQQLAVVHDALDTIRRMRFPVLNIDLIYGDPRQTTLSWMASLQAALSYQPEELYLYPLYVRPDTGLFRTGHQPARHRVDLYRTGRELLLGQGYKQTSLRCFRLPRPDAPTSYTCEKDGMVGLGCGARSYTSRLHYATKFAVNQAGVRAIVRDWISQTTEDMAQATHGIVLSDEEQRRRYVILSLLQSEGLCLSEYESRFASDPHADVPQLHEVRERGWVDCRDGWLFLTESGLEDSDQVGPTLYSDLVRSRLREFANR